MYSINKHHIYNIFCFRLVAGCANRMCFLNTRICHRNRFTKIGFEVQKTGDTDWCQHAWKTTGESSGFFPSKNYYYRPNRIHAPARKSCAYVLRQQKLFAYVEQKKKKLYITHTLTHTYRQAIFILVVILLFLAIYRWWSESVLCAVHRTFINSLVLAAT